MPESLLKWSCRTQACNFIKKRLWHGCFPENFVKFLTTPSLQNTSGRLLLKAVNYFRKKNLNHQKQSPRGVLLNFAKFTVKHLCQSLPFNKIAGLRPATLLKERLWHRCFLVNFAKFLRTLFFTEQLWWLLLNHICLKGF